MSRRRTRKVRSLRFEERLAWWRGHDGGHLCTALRDGLERGAYELTVIRSGTAWKCVLIPNASPNPRVWDDRCRWCPYCGMRVAIIPAPPRPASAAARVTKVVVPDCLPPEVGR